jgi:hypothetical protein
MKKQASLVSLGSGLKELKQLIRRRVVNGGTKSFNHQWLHSDLVIKQKDPILFLQD